MSRPFGSAHGAVPRSMMPYALIWTSSGTTIGCRDKGIGGLTRGEMYEAGVNRKAGRLEHGNQSRRVLRVGRSLWIDATIAGRPLTSR